MNDIAKITKAEIDKYKKMFNDKIDYYAINFNTKEEGEQVVDDFEIYKGDSGVDASWSGSIILEKDYFINWEFSILNGVYIDCKMRMNDSNKNVINNIYEVYTNWREDLSKYIVSSPKDFSSDTPSDSGEEIVSGGPAETSPEGESMPLSESRTTKGRQKTINESVNRMKRLAGLK